MNERNKEELKFQTEVFKLLVTISAAMLAGVIGFIVSFHSNTKTQAAKLVFIVLGLLTIVVLIIYIFNVRTTIRNLIRNLA